MLSPALKARIRSGVPTLGSWLTLAHSSVAEILAQAGYEWVMIDTEHTAIDASEVLDLIVAVENGGAVPLVRVAGIDPVRVKHAMDSGAAGVLVPNVRTRAEAELVVSAVKYPPQGSRGVGLARAHRYGPGRDDYFRTNNDASIVILQIEHVDAIRDIDAILGVQGIDAAFIGPYDLSASMGLTGQLEHPEMREASNRLLTACGRHGVAAGIHLIHPPRVADELATYLGLGFRFFALGSDALLLGDAARDLGTRARALVEAPRL